MIDTTANVRTLMTLTRQGWDVSPVGYGWQAVRDGQALWAPTVERLAATCLAVA